MKYRYIKDVTIPSLNTGFNERKRRNLKNMDVGKDICVKMSCSALKSIKSYIKNTIKCINHEDKVEISDELAGFRVRFYAAMVDIILFSLITTPLMMIAFGRDYMFTGVSRGTIESIFIEWLIPSIMTVGFWVSHSATPGKMIFSLQVIDSRTGKGLSWDQAILRCFAYIVSAVTLGLGYLCIAFHDEKRGFHDIISSTHVVIRRKQLEIFSEDN